MDLIKTQSQNIIAFQNATFSKNKLVIHNGITSEEWADLGNSLTLIEGSVQFWIGDWARYGEKRGFLQKHTASSVYDELEDITGLSRQTLKDYKSVADRTSSLRNDDLTFNHHKEVASLPPPQQEDLLNKASEEKMSVRDLRAAVKVLNQNFNVQPLPNGVFDVIYCDPPWQYNFSETDSRKIENQYPTMTVDEICQMELPQIAEDAVLIMWATAPKLQEALSVMSSWGFEYKTNCVWDKEIIGMGYWFRGRHELLLLGVKGYFRTPLPENRIGSVYVERRTAHSKKPDFFYEWIEKSFGDRNRIELFSRNKRQNWEVWGNE